MFFHWFLSYAFLFLLYLTLNRFYTDLIFHQQKHEALQQEQFTLLIAGFSSFESLIGGLSFFYSYWKRHMMQSSQVAIV